MRITWETKFKKIKVDFMSESKLRETVGKIYAEAKAELEQSKDETGLKNLKKYDPMGMDTKALRTLYKQILDDIDQKSIATLEAKSKDAVEANDKGKDDDHS